jgi:hypothetical protein
MEILLTEKQSAQRPTWHKPELRRLELIIETRRPKEGSAEDLDLPLAGFPTTTV